VRRLDPRIRWEDITMRMKKRDRASDNCIQWRLSRGWREAMGMLSWHLTSTKGNTAEEVANNRVVAKLTQWQLNHNTTRSLTPGRKDPRAPRDAPGNWIPWPTSKSGKDWGKAQTTSFTNKTRKLPGPRKPKAAKNPGAGTQDADEQVAEAQDTDEQNADEEASYEQDADEQLEDEVSEFSDEEVEQPTSSDSAYTLPSASSRMDTDSGVQLSQTSNRISRRAPGHGVRQTVTGTRQQHGSDPRLTQHQTGQATQNERFGVPRPGYNSYHRPQSHPSAPPAARPSNTRTQPFSSVNQTHQATLSNPVLSHNVLNRGAKRRLDDSDMGEDPSSQSQAKKPRARSAQSDGPPLSWDELIAKMPNPMTMFHKHKAENPHLYTKEAMIARKKAQPLLNMEELSNKYIKGQPNATQPAKTPRDLDLASLKEPAEGKSRSTQALIGGLFDQSSRGCTPSSDRGSDQLFNRGQQGTMNIPSMPLTSSVAHYPQNSQPYVTTSMRAPANRASISTVPSTVGTKRQFESLDRDDVPRPHQQAKKARQSTSRDTTGVNLGQEANDTVLKWCEEQQGSAIVGVNGRPMMATTTSQQAPNKPQVDQRLNSTPTSSQASSHAARPVPRNSQGQNFVAPINSDGTQSSSSQLMPRPSTPGYFGVRVPGSREDWGNSSTACHQAQFTSRSPNGSVDRYIKPTLLNDPALSNVTKPVGNSLPTSRSQITDAGAATSNDAPDEIFNLDFFDPNPSTENSIIPDFPASTTVQSQPEASSEGPMTALLNMDEFDFQMPIIGENGEF